MKLFLAIAFVLDVCAFEVKFLSSGPAPLNSTSGTQTNATQMNALHNSTQPIFQVVRRFRQSTASAMEDALTSLMRGGGKFGATPMGNSVRQMEELVTNEMMPKVLAGHISDQSQLDEIAEEIAECSELVTSGQEASQTPFGVYKKESGFHKKCRADEAAKLQAKRTCKEQQKSLYLIKQLKCKHFASVSKQYGTSKNNAMIVRKGGSESVQMYVTRLSNTFCGDHVHGSRGQKSRKGGWGGGLADGMLDKYLRAKDACEVATKKYHAKTKECKRKIAQFVERKAACNGIQSTMDSASCKAAVIQKDACESYSACYSARLKSFHESDKKAKQDSKDRKAEWKGLNRISCLVSGFADGQVTNAEIDFCRKRIVNTSNLDIIYPKIVPRMECQVSDLYPSTETYKKAEYAPLPVLAKGKEPEECSGIKEISITPKEGSPESCRCRRVPLNGYYSAGPIVKCTHCLDVYKATQKNSCPQGTKIFSPASRQDWDTFMESAEPLKDPHWIVDVTRPQNGCGGCTRYPMNSGVRRQGSWQTSDGSPWWLRGEAWRQPTGNYKANCYMNLAYKSWTDTDKIKFNDKRCGYHSRSYYCQLKAIDLKPRKGSPKTCRCTKVELNGPYSAENLIKCEHCLKVRKSTQRNSCPQGFKIFSPASREDWKTFIASAKPLRAPNFIVDVTRPRNGCGGCGRYPMKSSTPQQATWRTSDGSAWWLRSTRYEQPSGDYKANCYMDLWKAPHISEDEILFADKGCSVHASSYYCQTIKSSRQILREKPRREKLKPRLD